MDAEDGTFEDKIKRFTRARILEHALHVASFVVLLSTGLSQQFYSLDVSQWLILHLGGIDSVRLIHRFAGLVFCFQVMTHIVIAAIGIIYWKWQPDMIITKKDFSDIIVNIRYYLNIENKPARGARYTYKQKFEYWAILSSVLLMILSGVILWFPLITTKFLPGEIIPAAKVLHANQALVVFVIISIWHVYNAVFSPEVFPLDTSIFTGYISRERMLLEHPDMPVEYPRELPESGEKPAGMLKNEARRG